MSARRKAARKAAASARARAKGASSFPVAGGIDGTMAHKMAKMYGGRIAANAPVKPMVAGANPLGAWGQAAAARSYLGGARVAPNVAPRAMRAGESAIDPWVKAAKSMEHRKMFAGRGKYVAGAIAAGAVVGGIMRNTHGATKGQGRPTGIYQF